MKYSSSFYYDLELGEKSETWLNELFSDGKKIEVKTDLMADKTKNIYIEIYSRGKKSGLTTTQAEYWIFKLSNVSIIISTKTLKEIVRHCFNINGYKKGGDNDTSLGVLVPINLLFNENISDNI
jgi:hypothetical protein